MTNETMPQSSNIGQSMRSAVHRAARLAAIFLVLAIALAAFLSSANAADASRSVLLLGGCGNLGSGSLASGDFFDASAQSFSLVQGLAPQRVGYSATLLNNGKILVVGGLEPQGPSKKTLLFD